jgi:hypothetical protein
MYLVLLFLYRSFIGFYNTMMLNSTEKEKGKSSASCWDL